MSTTNETAPNMGKQQEAPAQQQGQQAAKPDSGLAALKTFLDGDKIKQRFTEILGKKAPGFIMSVLQIVNSSKELQACDVQSVYNAAATAAILDLPLNNNLQYAHIIGYKDRHKGGAVVAQFQMGWRGFVQLAQRSGKFNTINVEDVREGELVSRDRLSGECVWNWEQDDAKRETLKIIGFVAFFSLENGFRKTLYKTVDQLKAHGAKYSKTYNDSWGKWNTDFEAMCKKTVLKEILQKYAPLSIEMSQAIQADQAHIEDIQKGEVSYPDNPQPDFAEYSDLTHEYNAEKQAADALAKTEEMLLKKATEKEEKKSGKK